jgi:F0F1-type ATP synthase beta subunit
MEELSEEDKQAVYRARKYNVFPILFHVASGLQDLKVLGRYQETQSRIQHDHGWWSLISTRKLPLT